MSLQANDADAASKPVRSAVAGHGRGLPGRASGAARPKATVLHEACFHVPPRVPGDGRRDDGVEDRARRIIPCGN